MYNLCLIQSFIDMSPFVYSADTLQGKEDYLDVVHKYLELHGTVDKSASIPSYVRNHGIVRGAEVHALLRQSKVSMCDGLGHPTQPSIQLFQSLSKPFFFNYGSTVFKSKCHMCVYINR